MYPYNLPYGYPQPTQPVYLPGYGWSSTPSPSQQPAQSYALPFNSSYASLNATPPAQQYVHPYPIAGSQSYPHSHPQQFSQPYSIPNSQYPPQSYYQPQGQQRIQYQRLIHSDEIRLLKFEPVPNRGQGDIQCRVHHVRLFQSRPEYFALSYSWGAIELESKSTPKRNIWCNGQSLQIPSGMLTVLQSIAGEWEAKYVWIDKYCINQDDGEEKASQVKLMKQIYSLAHETIIWLGAQWDSPQIVNLAFQALQNFHQEFYGLDDPVMIKRKVQEVAARGQISVQQLMALATLLQRSWFSRVWVMQEAILSSNAVIHSGLNRLEWPQFCEQLRGILRTGVVDECLVRYRDPAQVASAVVLKYRLLAFLRLHDTFRTTANSSSSAMQGRMLLKLKDILRLSQYMDATVVKDRVYAVLGMSADAEKITVRYDAAFTVEDLLHHVAIHMLKTPYTCSTCNKPSCQFNELSILGESGLLILNEPTYLNLSPADKSALASVPSWVPTWMPRTSDSMWFTAHTSGYQASGESSPIIDVSAATLSRKLPIWGSFCSQITSTSDVGPSSNDLGYQQALQQGNEAAWALISLAQWVRQSWASVCQCIAEYPRRAEDFARTLCGDTFADLDSITEARPIGDGSEARALTRSFEDFMQLASFLERNAHRPRYQVFQEAMQLQALETGAQSFGEKCSMSQGRRFFLTQDRQMGLGPARMQAGDVVVIFAGATVPGVLRSTGVKGEYCYVGECYVHGLMDGRYWLANSERLEEMTLV